MTERSAQAAICIWSRRQSAAGFAHFAFAIGRHDQTHAGAGKIDQRLSATLYLLEKRRTLKENSSMYEGFFFFVSGGV